MPLMKMADNEVLGDAAAHFFKSGNVLRSRKNKEVENLLNLLPERGPGNTNIEYDLWYDVGGKTIKGFVYTDSMANFMYIRPANKYHNFNIMEKAASSPITTEGLWLFEKIKENATDKYSLKKKTIPDNKFVIFLPGTNIFNKAVDIDKVHRAVKQGAKLKMHPISASGLESYLRREFGSDTIIDKKISGHEVLDKAKIVGCCTNSEMGIAALAKDKILHIFDKDDTIRTYSSIYSAIKTDKGYSQDKLKSILSCEYSGLVPYYSSNPQKRIDNFFNYCGEFVNANK